MRDRRYTRRDFELLEFGFNPYTDILKGDDGAWLWANDREDLKTWVEDYFCRRNEDGVTTGR
jgi:hypothetical protein